MKYGYKGADSHLLIERYEIIDGKIKVYFLDKGSYEIPFKEKYEQEIIMQMLEQAENRMNSGELQRSIKRQYIRRVLTYTLGITLGAGSVAVIMNLTDSDYKAGILISLPVITAISMSTLACISRSDYKIDELKKYEIYLNLRKELENTLNLNVYTGIDMKSDTININTLDNYTLSDLYQLEENLGKTKVYHKECLPKTVKY